MRRSRRPPGWVAPGPPPRPPEGEGPAWPGAKEDLCHLVGDWRLLQRRDGHRWSLDDLVTAAVAGEEGAALGARHVADLGCGIGSVLLMLAWRLPEARLVGVEAQELSVDLARRSALWNGVTERCRIEHGDLRTWQPGQGDFDLISGTPPYLPPGTARESSRPQWGPCHFEHRGGVEAYVAAGARWLAGHGRLVLCAGGRDAPRVEAAATEHGLREVRRIAVVPRLGKATLFHVHVLQRQETSRGDWQPETLRVRDAEGAWTPDFRALRSAMGMPC